MPAATAVPLGAAFTFVPGGNAGTISAGSSIPIAIGQTIVLVSDGASGWFIAINGIPLNSPAFTGTPTVPTPASGDNSTKIINSAWSLLGFASSLALPGYIKFPTWLGGLVLQWAQGSPTGTTVNVAFPTSFPTGCLAVTASCAGGGAGTQTFTVNFITGNWQITGNSTYWLFAIGH
jgi:hypothetical protein